MKKVIIALIIIFIFLQFFPIDREIPAATPQLDFLSIKQTPGPIAEKIRSSCYDCHSNETKYPAYARIQPLGWFVQNHIQEGRKELNFSTFATYDYKRQLKKLEEAAEMRHALAHRIHVEAGEAHARGGPLSRARRRRRSRSRRPPAGSSP